MKKVNCWEYKKCGREMGGPRVNELGVCPVAVDTRLHGTHGGRMAGRACWVVAGTLCGGKEQGTFAKKFQNCEKCDFYKMVKLDEGGNYILSIMLLKKLQEAKPLIGTECRLPSGAIGVSPKP